MSDETTVRATSPGVTSVGITSSARTALKRGFNSRAVYHSRRIATPVRLALAVAVLVGTGTMATLEGLHISHRSAATCNPDTVLATWPLVKLANQTIVIPVEETDVLSVAKAAIDGYGGIILFGTAAPSNLGSELKEMRSEVPGGLGFLVMTDEEGGGVQRMANLVGNMPWAQTMGSTMTPSQIEA